MKKVDSVFAIRAARFLAIFFALAMVLLAVSCGGGSGDSGDDDDAADDDGSSDDDSADDDDDTADDDGDDDDADDDSTDDDTGDDDFGLTWVLIPAGTFEMGCVPADTDCTDDEVPQHTVVLSSDFYITETEITQAQYELVIGENPSTFTDCPDCPVETLTWNRTKEYCEAVGGRLPTEAEWEYAARGGTTSVYVCGDDFDCMTDYAWYSKAGESVDRPQPVKAKLPNNFGLYDVFGNVFEFTNDEMDGDYYASRPDPDVDPQGPDAGVPSRSTRGGSYYWGNWPDDYLRSSKRWATTLGDKFDRVGVRCAKDAP